SGGDVQAKTSEPNAWVVAGVPQRGRLAQGPKRLDASGHGPRVLLRGDRPRQQARPVRVLARVPTIAGPVFVASASAHLDAEGHAGGSGASRPRTVWSVGRAGLAC